MLVMCNKCGKIKKFYNKGLCEECFNNDGEHYLKNITGIYKIVNKINNKIYVGQAFNLYDRWKYGHIWSLKNNRHSNIHLQKSYNKYGEDNFYFEIIEECTLEELNEKEIYWISYFKSSIRLYGYNMTEGGSGTVGMIASEETKQKISDNTRGEKNGNAIISSEIAEKIKIRLIEANGKVREVSKEFNLEDSIVQNIKSLITWSYIRTDLNEQLRNMIQDRNFISEDLARVIKYSLIENEGSVKKVSKLFDVDRGTISNIKTLKTWVNIESHFNEQLRQWVSGYLTNETVILIKKKLIEFKGSIEKVCQELDVTKYDVANIKYLKNFIDVGFEYNETLKLITKELTRYEFSSSDLFDIRKKYNEGYKQKDLAIQYNCSYATISYIVNYKGKYAV
jgi:group I intron endonuclease